MATKRKYGYYLKGNNLAVVERESAAGMGTCSLSNYKNRAACEAAGGTWTKGSTSSDNFGKFKSPTTSITGGLEIQYAYSPYFNLNSTGTEGSDFHKFIGWGSDGTNLLLFTFSGASSVVNLSSLFAADDWIYIEGSGRWSGLHQVKSTGGATGILTLKTLCNLKPSTISFAGTFTASTATIDGHDTTDDKDMNEFGKLLAHRSDPYIFILNAENTANNGMFSASFNTDDAQITVSKKITISTTGVYTSSDEAIVSRTEDTINIYNVFYEQISVYEGIEVLEDENFNIDLPRYLANAIVYYMKAKVFEDIMDIEKKEYFMREFKRQVEKFQSTRKRGVYKALGYGMTR